MYSQPTFKSVQLPHAASNGEGTTQLMNLRSKNLFEIYNAAEICDESLAAMDDSAGFDSSKTTIKSVIIDDNCYVCANQTVHCFKVGNCADHTATFELEDLPADICVVPGQKIIMFMLQNGSVCFFAQEHSKLTSAMSIFDGSADSYKTVFGGFGLFLCMGVLATYSKSHSEAKFVKFPSFTEITQGSAAFFGASQIIKTTNRLNLCYIAGDKFGFAFFPKRKDTPILKQCVYSLHFGVESSEPMVSAYSLPYGVQSVHQIGKLIGVLTQGLECILFNSLDDLVPAGVLQLGNFRGDIYDFAILDFDATVLNPKSRMIVHINNGSKDKILLTDVQSSSIAFEFECSSRMCLNPWTAQTELNNNVVIVESFSSKRPTSIQLRFIFEAQPIVRLRNLLDRCRFEEALDCARVYNLSLDQVYERQIAFLIEGINNDGRMSSDELDKLLALLNNLVKTSEESAVDYAFLAVIASTECVHIQKLLNFCNKCQTSDENLAESIERLKYALESYNSLFGSKASYTRDSYWPRFWVGENHWELFVKMLSESKIEKCAELWNRYRSSLSYLLVDSSGTFFIELLQSLERTIAGSSGTMCYKISEFLEKDLLPPFFTEEHLSHLIPFQAELMDFFKRVSLSLWQLDQKNFPKNAYDFSSTIARIVANLTSSVDSRQKKLVARCLDDLGIGSMDSASPYVELDRTVVKLKHLNHLKEAYNFVSSYEAYHNLTAEEIGSLLLDKIYTMANNIAYVKDIVFKYCDEVGLDRDTLLLNYIKKSDLSKIANVCIGLCKLFKNDDFRAESAMLIAPSFSLPWSRDLSEMFEHLRSKEKLPEMTKQQLKETMLCAQISVILKEYGGGFMLDILDSHDIIDYCISLFAHTEVPIKKRVQDAQQICTLSMQNTKIATTEVECFVNVIKCAYSIAQSLEELNQILAIFEWIKDLNILENLTEQCAAYAYRMLSVKNVLDVSIPLCSDFLIRIAQHLPAALKSEYVKKAASICQLYKLYQVVVFADKLSNVNESSGVLRSVVGLDGEAEKQTPELIEIGTLLLLSKEDIVIQLLLFFVSQDRIDRVEELLKLIPALFDQLKSDELIEAIYYGLSFLFRFFSDYNWSVLDVEKLAEFADSIKSVTALIFKHTTNEFYLTKFSAVLEYIHFLENTLSICKNVDLSSSNATSMTDGQIVLSEEEEVFLDLEQRLKLPIYSIRSEPKSANSNTVLQSVCKVAESVCQSIDYLNGWKAKNTTMPGAYRTQWITLITVLTRQHIDLLAIEAAQICIKLELFAEHQNEILVLYDQSVVNLLERQLTTLNVDWISVMENLGFRGARQSSSLVRALRELPEILKNRVLVVNSYLLKFMFPESSNINIQTGVLQIKRLSWQRELFSYGLNISSKVIDHPERYLDQLVDRLISPSLIVSLCRSNDRKFEQVLLDYAIHLCISHSTKKTNKRSLILKCAEEALNLIENPPVETVRNLLLAVDQRFSPYDYESIEMALNWCQQHLNDTDFSDWVAQMQKLIAFLRVHKRRSGFIQQELDWFSKRQPLLRHKSVNETNHDETLMENIIPVESDPLKLSFVRLPFQVFLATDEEGKAIGRAIVTNQITTETLQDWITLSMELPRLLPYTRVFLESSCICADLQRCLERRMMCDEKLMLRVLSIIHFNRNLVSILSHVSSELSGVVQSEHKVKVFEQLTLLLDKRLKNTNESTEFANEGELTKAQKMYKSMLNGRNAFFVLNLLAKYNLLNSKTSALAGRVSELCKHIFNRVTNWSDSDEIAAHVKFVGDLDKQGLVSIESLFDEMINDWLKSFEFDQNISDMTLDISMETDGDQQIGAAKTETIPYFSTEVTRMAFLLKNRCTVEVADKIKSLEFSISKEGPKLKFTILCIVLRAFDNDKIGELFGMTKENFLIQFP